MAGTHLVELVGTLAAEVVLAGQDDHRLGENFKADRADELPLQCVQGLVPVVGAQLQGQRHGPQPLCYTLQKTPRETRGDGAVGCIQMWLREKERERERERGGIHWNGNWFGSQSSSSRTHFFFLPASLFPFLPFVPPCPSSLLFFFSLEAQESAVALYRNPPRWPVGGWEGVTAAMVAAGGSAAWRVGVWLLAGTQGLPLYHSVHIRQWLECGQTMAVLFLQLRRCSARLPPRRTASSWWLCCVHGVYCTNHGKAQCVSERAS